MTQELATKPEVLQVDNCRACDNKNLTTFLQLGPTPIPNGFLEASELNQAEKFYPLDVSFCGECGMVQLGHVVDPNVMFKNYVYVPSTSTTMVQHFGELATDATQRVNLETGDLVVDIGSNDGTLLKAFKRYGATILGVDPATNLATLANEQGVPTINELFDKNLALSIRSQHGPARVISATNVVAHVHNLHDFFEGVHDLLADNGKLVMEFPYLVNLIEGGEFDTIYQEHLSYLSINPLQKLLAQHGLNLTSPRLIDIHGGSIRVFATKSKPESDDGVTAFITTEREKGMLDLETYSRFQMDVNRVRHDLVEALWSLRFADRKVVGYGASAKGNILTNYCRIGVESLPYIVDSIPYKQGKYTPGMHIPIYPEDQLLEDQPDYALLLAWNFADEIVQKQGTFQKRGGKFIRPIPVLKVIHPSRKV
ncbi:MAG: class I SAM-dependent methyltransferase [Candidatus Daviesbacteria bacterium]|nr:MAG: class I SAM-dependent methyltransferase [Candidatus Daviesbacteria bacterium]